MKTITRTERQNQIALQLAEKFGFDVNRILFINSRDENDAWIPPSELKNYAREYTDLKEIDTNYDKYIPETQQVICKAKVVNKDGIIFSDFGAATAKPGDEIPAEIVATGRALSAALTSAGFHPLKGKSVQNLELKVRERLENGQESDAIKRTRDLRQIHGMAADLGMITFPVDEFGEKHREDSSYRWWLVETFPDLFDSIEKATVVNLSELNRKRIIDKLYQEKTETQKQTK